MQGVGALDAAQYPRLRFSKERFQCGDGDVHRFIGCTAQGTAHIVDDGAPGFVANVLRNMFQLAAHRVFG